MGRGLQGSQNLNIIFRIGNCPEADFKLLSVSRIWASWISRGWFVFRLEPIFNTTPAASKNNAQFKSGQNQPNNKSSYFINLNVWLTLQNCCWAIFLISQSKLENEATTLETIVESSSKNSSKGKPSSSSSTPSAKTKTRWKPGGGETGAQTRENFWNWSKNEH